MLRLLYVSFVTGFGLLTYHVNKWEMNSTELCNNAMNYAG
jgi:hypothetical protein